MTSKQNQDISVSKSLTVIAFSNKRPGDQALITEANAFLRRPENEGIPGTSALRNFFKRVLQAANNGQLKIMDNQSARIA